MLSLDIYHKKGLILNNHMKLNRTNIFIIISSLALIILLIIQINWIFQTAKIKEEFFNEKANIVLSRATESIQSDKETCRKIGECGVDINSNEEPKAILGKDEVNKIDSIFTHYMQFYNFHIDYKFEVIKPRVVSANSGTGFSDYIYNKTLTETDSSALELKLIFPEKKQFIMAEMGSMFIASVLLILIVLIMFWRTIISLIKEKKISEHTTEFLNNMTHEFKTPLTNIALAGRMIVKDSTIVQEDKIKHYSGIILEENEKLRLQVEHMLSMTALERGEIPLQKEILDFHELIKESFKCIGIQIENKEGNFKLQLKAENYNILGDKTHLTNALCNLIDNAIKYSKLKPELTIQSFNRAEYLVVSVSDNGIGIDKEYQKLVFDKFFRVPTGDVHNVKGFGLGLSYTKKIVELHGGTIELHSEIGKATTFTITLPYV